MIKKVYEITGFDCANCAAKAEAHLNKYPGIAYARIDFAGNHLYITYQDKELLEDEILAIVQEVESDKIEIKAVDNKIHKLKLFDRHTIILIGRIVYAILVILLCGFVLKDNSFYWWRFGLYLSAVIVVSYDVIYKPIYKIFHKQNPIDEYLLIMIAAIGAFVLASLQYKPSSDPLPTFLHEEHIEAIMVVGLFQIGRVVEAIATKKSRFAVLSAINLRAEFANRLSDDGITLVKPENLKIGDVIIVKTGESIPVDGRIIEGEAYLDLSSLTGEYIPVRVEKDQQVLSGCILKSGTLTIQVEKMYVDSTVSKIMNLISTSGERKTKAAKFITKFARWYTPLVVVVSLLYILIVGLVTKQWQEVTYQGLEILVIACPCAIVISVPLAYFSAIGLSSKHGIVVKGTDRFDDLVKMRLLVTDKTGTLTHGSFSIQSIVPTSGVKESQLLESLYAAECLSNHPIGKAICHGHNFRKLAAEQRDFKEIPGLGTETTYRKNNIIAGSKVFFSNHGISTPDVIEVGTPVYVAKGGKYLGYVLLADQLKEDAQPMVDLLHHDNIEILLLTGDKEENAKGLTQSLGIDRYVSELSPEGKAKVLEIEMEKQKGVAFIGDGINDAPSIKRSDIGIAMGGIGSDTAVESSDIVIMNDDPAKVYDAYKIAKMARNTAIFNIVFSLFVKITVMILVMTEINIPMYIAVLADTGLTVLMVINSLILLYRKVKRPKI
ncbi:MAG TPA: heavy metal translocating P-type ATPase [Bacilli bacterium]|nr:heavy metal translocating P-type ATPase [Bacilli bacterium]HPS19315.1 heavy metal translocating P-type ATPase [Bacilli bacterium]